MQALVTNFLVDACKPTDLSGKVLNGQSGDASSFRTEQVGHRPSKPSSLSCPTSRPYQCADRWVTRRHTTVKLFGDQIYQKKPSISIQQLQRPAMTIQPISQTESYTHAAPVLRKILPLYCKLVLSLFTCAAKFNATQQPLFHPRSSKATCLLGAPNFVNTHEHICPVR